MGHSFSGDGRCGYQGGPASGSRIIREVEETGIVEAADGSGAVLGFDGNIVVARDAEGNMVMTVGEGSTVVGFLIATRRSSTSSLLQLMMLVRMIV